EPRLPGRGPKPTQPKPPRGPGGRQFTSMMSKRQVSGEEPRLPGRGPKPTQPKPPRGPRSLGGRGNVERRELGVEVNAGVGGGVEVVGLQLESFSPQVVARQRLEQQRQQEQRQQQQQRQQRN
ncbi:hypothetical protein HK102_007069, partial [Quaeritorhiza haematococci]